MVRSLLKRGIGVAVLTVLLLAMIPVSAFPVNALQSRTANFSDQYTLTGYGAADMVSIALAQENKTGKQLGYTEEWCCNFISDCAILAGQTSAIPAYAYCSGLYNAILSAGGKKTTSSPQPGDICFINWDGGSSFQHVEIVYKVENGLVYTIGGNSGGGSSLYNRCVYTHDPLSSKYIVCIVRPNYQVLDTSYITKCSKYPTYCTIRVSVDSAELMSQPCTSDVDAESVAVSTVTGGTELTAVAVYSNSLGQLWYAVNSGSDTVYIHSSNTEFVGGIESGISITGVVAPETLTEGSSFSVKGTVKSSGIALSQVYGYVMDGEDVLTGTKAEAGSASYSLQSSAVNKGLKFSVLSPGEYSYVLGAAVSGYYAGSDQSLQKYTVTVELYRSVFTVKEKPVHVCQWDFAGYAEKHPHYARYKCAGCGKTKTDDSKTAETEDCSECFPEPEYQPPMALPAEHHLMENVICFHPLFASCSHCEGESTPSN